MKKMINTAKISINKALIFIVLFGFRAHFSSAQSLSLPLHHETFISVDRLLAKTPYPLHTGFKPILQNRLSYAGYGDSIIFSEPIAFIKQKPKNIILRKLLYEELVRVKSDNFSLALNFLTHLQRKNSKNSDASFTINTRGMEVKGHLGRDISYYTAFYENQAFFEHPLDSFAAKRLVVPGHGAHKAFRDSGYDYSSAVAYLSYSPNEILNVRVGHDKHFVGEGYRSMLLSDNAFNYPFLEFSVFKQQLQYHSFVAQYEDFTKVYYNYHRRKHIAVNYLSYYYRNFLEIGLFEGVLYQSLDTTDYSYHLSWDFFTPFPVVRSLANVSRDDNYLLTGLQFKLNPLKYITLYGQLALSPGREGAGIQGGVKLHDLFFDTFEPHRLFLRLEYNNVSNNLYIHNSEGFQTWSHYNQELAHPLGSNFTEWLVRGQYRYRRLSLFAGFIHRAYDPVYSDIFLVTDVRENMQDTPTESSYISLTAAYTINPANRFQVFAGTEIRNYGNETKNYILFGLRTALRNLYTDFI